MRLAVSLALVFALGVADSAGATENATILASLNNAGSGMMSVSSATNPPGETWSWQACAADGSACAPFSTGRSVTTGTAGAGTLFVATANDGPTAKSPVWHGNVAAATPPSVSGAVRANALVTPVLGTWKGGWDGDFDQTQLAACREADGTDCTSLTSPNYTGGCPNGAAVIDPRFAGRYLLVADQRFGVNTAFAAFAVVSPYGPYARPHGPTTSVAVVGRIAPATGPPESACGPHPSATLSIRGDAFINCPLACKIVLRAHRGSRRVRVVRTLRGPGTLSIQLPRRALRSLRPRATFSIEVDGTRLAQRSIAIA